MFENKFSMHASFGLWLELFLDELLWSRDSQTEGETVRHDLAHSWDWASLKGLSIAGASTLYSSETGEERHLIDSFSATMVSMPRTTGFTPLNPILGHEISNSFRLHGCLMRYVHRVAKLRSGEGTIDCLDPVNCGPDTRRDVRQYYPDTKDEKGFFCFLVRREHRRRRTTSVTEPMGSDTLWDHYLVLSPLEGSQNRFGTGTYTEIFDVAQTTKDAADTRLDSIRTYIFTGPLDSQEIEVC
ncbi:hypothetical protein J3E72DRAFT_375330 [Bipolaris maydis]|nr:hypothetical protein BM1_00633 [Bipolaris maydis]KAJ5041406.1 hypothetical protein J3E74DRAFT_450228 [Bipolaris maydis]KAJ5064366.1 hypothetical protein J3E74DRAFT_444504 [Bipolaris maydis]KAJ6196489.1 hypothetical protein J3E72DRAFT_375330 [Bipolaris maydis]